VVLGAAFMLVGENSRTVAGAARDRLEQVARSLPPGVHALPVYDRSALVDKAIRTVRNNLSKARCWWWRSCSSSSATCARR
jgi:cobalt-zinc-cadmium resistance protein CzcA